MTSTQVGDFCRTYWTGGHACRFTRGHRLPHTCCRKSGGEIGRPGQADPPGVVVWGEDHYASWRTGGEDK